MSKKMTDEQALAFVYQVFRDVLDSFPTFIDDYVYHAGVPDEYDYEDEYELIQQADRAAAELSK
jgi:hypothetical protein